MPYRQDPGCEFSPSEETRQEVEPQEFDRIDSLVAGFLSELSDITSELANEFGRELESAPAAAQFPPAPEASLPDAAGTDESVESEQRIFQSWECQSEPVFNWKRAALALLGIAIIAAMVLVVRERPTAPPQSGVPTPVQKTPAPAMTPVDRTVAPHWTYLGGSESAETSAGSAGLNSQAEPLRTVAPIYPEKAKETKAAGTVDLDVTVDENGNVARTAAVNGPPLLWKAAEEAVSKWKFRPARHNGVNRGSTVRVGVVFALPSDKPPVLQESTVEDSGALQ